MSFVDVLDMEGSLQDDNFTRFLAAAEDVFLYGRIELTKNGQTNSMVLASGRIILECNDDIMSRRTAQNEIIELVHSATASSGTFRCAPIAGLADLDLLPTVSITDIL